MTAPGSRIVALAILVAAPVAAPSDEIPAHRLRQAQKLATRGARALEAGNSGQARSSYQEAVEAVPDFPDAHLGLGHLAMRERRFEDALSSYERARTGYVNMAGALFTTQVRRFQDAQDQLMQLRAAIESLRQQQNNSQGSDPETALRLARLEQEAFRLEQVKRPSDEGERAVPAEVEFFVGNALMNLGQTEAAIAAWRKALRENPKFAPAYNNLAVAYWKSGRLDEAAECVARAQELGIEVNPAFQRDLERSREQR